jgi:preprotein translocase subunit SecG
MGFILVLHIIVTILLVISILMQAGRGGGLTETFQSAESMFGTQTNALMVRITTILAVIFFCTSLFLAMHSSKTSQSLMGNKKLLATVPATVPAKPSNDVQVKVEEPKAMPPAAATETTPETKEVPVNAVTNAAQ